MTHEEFWQIISDARAGVDNSVEQADEVARAAAELLAARPLEEILQFQTVFDDIGSESYRHDLWAAAYLIQGGCSDDGFDYFCGWLVVQGHEVWTAALQDPDSLADVVGEDVEDLDGEDVLAIASSAYEIATGDDDAFWAAVPPAGDGSRHLKGEEIDPEDEPALRLRFPRLAALFSDD